MCNVSLNGTQPTDASIRVLCALEAAGLEAWYVGGWVRDALMGRPSHDVDMCCSGLWQESKAALESADIAVVESSRRIAWTVFTPMAAIPRVWSVRLRLRTIWRAVTLPLMPWLGIPIVVLSTATMAKATLSVNLSVPSEIPSVALTRTRFACCARCVLPAVWIL